MDNSEIIAAAGRPDIVSSAASAIFKHKVSDALITSGGGSKKKPKSSVITFPAGTLGGPVPARRILTVLHMAFASSNVRQIVLSFSIERGRNVFIHDSIRGLVLGLCIRVTALFAPLLRLTGTVSVAHLRQIEVLEPKGAFLGSPCPRTNTGMSELRFSPLSHIRNTNQGIF